MCMAGILFESIEYCYTSLNYRVTNVRKICLEVTYQSTNESSCGVSIIQSSISTNQTGSPSTSLSVIEEEKEEKDASSQGAGTTYARTRIIHGLMPEFIHSRPSPCEFKCRVATMILISGLSPSCTQARIHSCHMN